jgi:hypothetical protein
MRSLRCFDPRLTFEEWDPAQPVDKSQEPTSMMMILLLLFLQKQSLLKSTRVHCVPLVSSSIKLFLHILRQLRAAV